MHDHPAHKAGIVLDISPHRASTAAPNGGLETALAGKVGLHLFKGLGQRRDRPIGVDACLRQGLLAQGPHQIDALAMSADPTAIEKARSSWYNHVIGLSNGAHCTRHP